jgi:hypothetical protein
MSPGRSAAGVYTSTRATQQTSRKREGQNGKVELLINYIQNIHTPQRLCLMFPIKLRSIDVTIIKEFMAWLHLSSDNCATSRRRLDEDHGLLLHQHGSWTSGPDLASSGRRLDANHGLNSARAPWIMAEWVGLDGQWPPF